MLALGTSLNIKLPTSIPRFYARVSNSKRSTLPCSANSYPYNVYLRSMVKQPRVQGMTVSFLSARPSSRQMSSIRPNKYEAPTAENNSVGKPVEDVSHIAWWDKIGVNTTMDFKAAQNWHHPAMTDQEIENLVQQMPTDLELAGLSPKEREEYLRARYNAIQASIVRSRSAQRRDPNYFEPVTLASSWRTESYDEHFRHVPRDAPSMRKYISSTEDLGNYEYDATLDYEDFPHQPYGPRLPPPPLPDVTYWKHRKNLQTLSTYDKVLLWLQDRQEAQLIQAEADFIRRYPWFSHNESERIQAEQKLRMDPKCRPKIQRSINEAQKLRQARKKYLDAREERQQILIKAQGGFERLAWHQINDVEWKEMSDVEFAYWRHRIFEDWMKENGQKRLLDHGHELEHAGTVTIALRHAVQDWQKALYEYEKAKRPQHLTPDDNAIWHYELSKTEWFKAGKALLTRLAEVEKKAVLHRRKTVLEFLANTYADWTAYYTTALENARVLDKWGVANIASLPPESVSGYLPGMSDPEVKHLREKMESEWRSTMTSILHALQRHRENGPLPFEMPLEKLDQHTIDSIYAFLKKEEESTRQNSETKRYSSINDLPPIPSGLKAIIETPMTMLVSSGDDASSGLFGPKLAAKRRDEAKSGILKTVQEMERRKRLMMMYWHEHGITELEIDGTVYAIPQDLDEELKNETIPFFVVERSYFELMDQGLDVHGLYEKPQWLENDATGQYRASELSPFDHTAPTPINSDFLRSAGSQVALNLLNDLIILAFPQHHTSEHAKLSFFEAPRAWSTLGFMAPPKQRDIEKLRNVTARGIPAVLRMEREAAFFIAENEPIDPHPHLWQRLLTLVWKMRMPPRWLIGRYPDTYAEWKDLTDFDFLESHEGASIHDPKQTSLMNPRRKAWELERRAKDYRNLLRGDKLLDPTERRHWEMAMKCLKDMEEIFIAELSGAESMGSMATNDQSKLVQFEQQKRDLVTPEEVEAMEWMSEFDITEFIQEIGGVFQPLILNTQECETYHERFTNSFLMATPEWVEPSSFSKLFETQLNGHLAFGGADSASDALKLEKELFHRRQKIQKAHDERGLTPAATAFMMHYYYAYSIKRKIDLVKRHTVVDSTLSSWTNRFFTQTDHSKVMPTPQLIQGAQPQTILTGLYQLAMLPVYLFRFATAGVWPSSSTRITRPRTRFSANDDATERDRSKRKLLAETEAERSRWLVDITRHLDELNEIQPWCMWTQEPWNWRTSLMSEEQAVQDREAYEARMNYPRRMFWYTQQKLWEDYVDHTLAFSHQLMIEQRIRRGLPTNRSDAIIDGTAAAQQFWRGQELLDDMKITDAIECFEMAARYGNSDALLALGRLHTAEVYRKISDFLPEEDRLQQPELELKSRRYLQRAVELGSRGAIDPLVTSCMIPPHGAPLDITLAVNALRTAIQYFGSAEAKVALAFVYEKLNNPTDLHHAMELYKQVDTKEAKNKARELYVRLYNREWVDAGDLKDVASETPKKGL